MVATMPPQPQLSLLQGGSSADADFYQQAELSALAVGQVARQPPHQQCEPCGAWRVWAGGRSARLAAPDAADGATAITAARVALPQHTDADALTSGLSRGHGRFMRLADALPQQRFFDRQPTQGFAKRPPSPMRGPMTALEDDLPAYQEVRVERFGWRRSSFISRRDSVLLETR